MTDTIGAIDTIVANAGPGEMRVALLAGESTLEVFHHRAGRPSVAGGVFLGRVTRVVPGMQAAFVDIGLDRPGFLNAADARGDPGAETGAIGDYVHEGEAVLAQAVRDPAGGKGARLTLRPTLPGRRLVFAPGRGGATVSRRIGDAAERARLEGLIAGLDEGDGGFVARTAAAGADCAALARDAAALRAEWAGIAGRRAAATPPECLHRDLDPLSRALRDHGARRVVADSAAALAQARAYCEGAPPGDGPALELYGGDAPIFERFGVEAALEEALEPLVALPSGAALVIEETEALCAVDVDTRGCTGGGGGANLLRANLDAAPRIARQLRLRAIGGLIVIDFAHMARAEHRRRVLEALRGALAGDGAASPPHGFTRLGLVEMTRRRTRPPLSEVLCDPRGPRRKSAATVALDIARAVARKARAMPQSRLTVIAAPEVAAALSAPGPLAALAETLGRAVEVRADADRGRDSHEIVAR